MEPAESKNPTFTSSISQEDLETLCMMGFPKEYIHIAYNNTKEKNLQAVSDWLLENTNKIETIIQNEKNAALKKDNPDPEPNKSEEKSIKPMENLFESLAMENSKESKSKPKKDAPNNSQSQPSKGKKGAISEFLFNQKPPKKSKGVDFNELNDGNDDNNSDHGGGEEEKANPANKWKKENKFVQEDVPEVKVNLSNDATYRLLDISKELVEFEHKSVLDIIKFLYDIVNKLKLSKDKHSEEILEAMSNIAVTDGLVGSVRRNLFRTFNILFKQKIDRSHRAFVLDLISDISMLETAILTVMELKIFSREQYQVLKAGYLNFCKKVKIRQKKEIMDFSIGVDKKVYQPAADANPESNKEGWDNVDSEEDQANEEQEGKTQKGGDEAAEKKKNSKSYCVICKVRTKEIVFLPCAHFVACAECSPDFANCPACSGGIDQKLRIYWS